MEEKLAEQEKTLNKLTKEMEDSDSQRQEDVDDGEAGFFDKIINSFLSTNFCVMDDSYSLSAYLTENFLYLDVNHHHDFWGQRIHSLN